MDLFMLATRNAFRFPSKVGELTTEQLWQLPLTSKNGASLDGVAKAVNAELKTMAEESFVEEVRNPGRALVEAKLDIVKAIISVKQDEAKKNADRARLVEERRKIMEAIENKENQELSQASKEDLLKRLAQLEAA